LARSRHATTSPYAVNGNSFYHADGNGNVTYLANSSGGADAAYRYDPFGRGLAQTGPYASANGMRFSSKPWVAHNGSNTDGLYSYGYRFYDPLTQRWLNRDPLGEGGGINLYTFGRNAPVLYIDPSGQSAIAIGGPIAGGCAVADGPLPIGDIIACGILIGCVIYDACTPDNPGGGGGYHSKPRKCGDCTPAEHAALQAAVNAACKSGPRACKGNQDLATLEANLAKNLACAAARDAINNKCFKGGDAGHRQAANEARNAAANCTKLIAQKKAAQPAIPQPPNPQPPQP
jgi:RHS repeat-associated protein